MASRILTHSAADYLPKEPGLEALCAAAARCRGCELYQQATQTVFGEGKQNAQVVLVGEQPGDREDVSGRPFVGPAGRLLDQALERAGLDRAAVYVTNAVKHFKWEPRGKRRIHKKPTALEIAACRPWLEAELQAVQPQVIIVMGASAALALLGSSFKVSQHRGELITKPNYPAIIPTIHPSAILRAVTPEERQLQMEGFVADLKSAAELLHEVCHGAT